MITDLKQIEGAGNAADPAPTFGERMGASWRADTVRTDAWFYSARVRNEVTLDIYNRLPQDAQERLFKLRSRAPDTQEFERQLLNEAGLARSAGDPRWTDVPATAEDIAREVDRRRLQVLDDAEAVLGDAGGGGVAGFLGSGAREMTRPANLALAPFGMGGGLLRFVVGEAILGGVAGAVSLPAENKVAGELGLSPPAPVARIAEGALFAGATAGALAGAGRFLRYARDKRAAIDHARPAGVEPLDWRDSVQNLRDRMEMGAAADTPLPAPAQLDMGRPATPDPGTLGDLLGNQPLRMSDFDFSAAGNASPGSNRVGYVFGRLLELGYEPHIAAGLTGNLMQESGVAINPRAIGDSGNAFGMAQWNGPRKQAYLDFATARGTGPANIDTQIAFLDHELKTSEQAAAARILAAPDARTAAEIASNEFWRPGTPHLDRRMAYAGTVMQQYERGQVPRWDGARAAGTDTATGFTAYATSRPFTGTGQVMVGDNLRLDVTYQVVDMSTLRQAGGDLQPRDRARAASDAWVNDTAARLDPAQLMPAPTADRGAPMIGPDNIIESGNGRVRAIDRAYDRFPDRADAYRQQIEATTGQPIPAGVERPVLIARRQSALEPAARRQMVVDAQDSGVARMNATERARIGQGALNADLLKRIDAARMTATERARIGQGAASTAPGRPAPTPDPEVIPENAFADGAASPEAQAGDDLAAGELQAMREAVATNGGDLSIDIEDGPTVTARALLDDLDADARLDTILDLCASKGGL